MTPCPHRHLTLLTTSPDKLRCRRCHLTISRNDVGGNYCPECYDTQGLRHSDFESVTPADQGKTRYRCEDCGMFIPDF